LKHKFEEKRRLHTDFIKACREEQVKKCKQLGIESGKQKQEVEKSAFADFLNKHLETNHSKAFTTYFKHNLLYFNICTNKERAGSSNEYCQRFQTCLSADENNS
jgi:hypothetical protein